jgi:hypothetical protein
MKVCGLKCLKCQDVIFSRTRHDYRSCTCCLIAIDGGFDYLKISGNTGTFQIVEINLPDDITRKMLYDDWNERKDIYGKIKDYDSHNFDIKVKIPALREEDE